MNSQKVVTKPPPECPYPGVKTGVQVFYDWLNQLDSGFRRNDQERLSAPYYEIIS